MEIKRLMIFAVILFSICQKKASAQIDINSQDYTKVCTRTLNPIVIKEVNADDFKDNFNATSGTPISQYYALGFSVSGKYNFVTSATVTVSIDKISGSGTATKSISSATVTSTKISFDYTMKSTINEITKITISGIEVVNLVPDANCDIVRISSGSTPEGDQFGNQIANSTKHAGLDSRINLAITRMPVVGKDYACVGMPIEFTASNISGAVYDLYRQSPSSTKLLSDQASNIIQYTPNSTRNNPVYYAEAKFGGTCVLRSNTVTITSIEDRPKATEDLSLLYNFTVFDNPVPLERYVTPDGNSEFVPYPFGFKPYLYVYNSGSFNYMIPSSAYLSNDFKLGYTIQAKTGRSNEGCKYTDTLANSFNIINPTTPPPYFSYANTPICELSTYEYSDVSLGRVSWLPSNAIMTSIKLYYASNNVVSFPVNSSDKRTAYFFFNPSLHDNYRIKIEVRYSYTSGSITYNEMMSGYYYIFKRRDVTVKGFSQNPLLYYINNSTYTDTAKICSASNDPLILTGSPSGGNYEFFECNDGSCSSMTPLPDFGTTIDIQNSSVYKLIPSILFKKIAMGDPSKIYLLKYSYPTLRIGDCPETRQIYLKFLKPTDLKYSITSPVSIDPTVNLFCNGNTIHFGVEDYIADDSVFFDYGDGFNTINFSPNLTYSHTYTQPGKYILRYKTDREGALCNNDILDTIRIGAQPIADFSFSNNYENRITKMNSLSEIATKNNVDDPLFGRDDIYNWSWYYGDGSNSLDESDSITYHPYPYYKAHPYSVTHEVKSGWGCKASVVKKVPIFPIIKPLPISEFKESFDATDSTGFYQSGDYKLLGYPLSSWKNEEPLGDVIKNTGTLKAWITSKAKTPLHSIGYYETERSYVESPAFDLSQLDNPMISFDTWCNTDNLFDGASLQYAICDTTFGNETWITLGGLDGGNNWYNSNTVVSSPGGELLGWTGFTDKKMKLSSYGLEDIKLYQRDNGLMNYPVRFRVVLGTNGDNTPNKVFDGFAFDNFFIGEKNRKVLVEEFCDYNSCEFEFENFTKLNKNQLIRIQYHSRYENLNDEINNQNIGENGARSLLYGYSKLPRAAVDGTYSVDYNNGFFNNSGEFNFKKRVLHISPFKMKINVPSLVDNALKFSVDITRNSTLNNEGPFVVQVVALEYSVSANGKIFTNVFRKFLPDAGGEHIGRNEWPLGDINKKTLNRSFTPSVPLTARTNPTDTSIVLVAFVQDEATSEVYQSEAIYVPYSVVQSLQPVPLPAKVDVSGVSITLYPNPAQNNLMVYFENGKAPEEYQYRMIDGFGKTVKSGQIPKDATDFTLYGLQDFPVGMYQLQLLGNSNATSQSFSIVR